MSNLCLTRKAGERIRLRTASGEEVWLTVARVAAPDGHTVRHGKVSLLITADRSVLITREELLEQDGGGVATPPP